MEDTESKWRIKQIYERAQVVLRCLDTINKISKTSLSQRKRDFVGPQEVAGHEKHWKNFCVSSRRQLYGLNQKIMHVKRSHQSSDALDVEMLRLISQASLNSSQLLRGLLQFPSMLKPKSGETDSTDVAAKIVTASKHLLLILQQLGFVPALEKDACKGVSEDSFGTSIENVESSVVEELLERDMVSKHLAKIAKLKLDTSKKQREETAPAVRSVLLPRGRQMQLVEDSLSHLLRRQRPSGHTSRGAARSASVGVVSLPTKVRHKRPKPSHRRRHRSTSERRSSSHQRRRKEDGDQDEETQRHQLWQQLLPLLLNQEALDLNATDTDLPSHLRRLDDILERLDSIQASAEYNSTLQKECDRLEALLDQKDDSLDSAIREARNLLRKYGYLPPDSTGAFVSGESEEDSDSRHQNSGKENFAYAVDNFSDIRKRRESFWATLAQEGYVGT